MESWEKNRHLSSKYPFSYYGKSLWKGPKYCHVVVDDELGLMLITIQKEVLCQN